MAYTVTTMLSSGKGKSPKLTDFVLRWSGRRRRQSAQEQLNVFRALASQLQKD